jgi:hypothetical protein
MPGGRSVDLAEGLEEPVHPIGGDSDAGVANRHIDFVVLIVQDMRHNRDHDFARRGELDGVTEQIDEDLAQPGHIAEQGVWNMILDHIGQIDMLFRGARREQIERALETVAQVKGLLLEVELA